MRTLYLLPLVMALCSAASAVAGPPGMPGQYATHGYSPQLNRYAVIDPVPHHTPGDPHHPGGTLWTRRDANVPAYPYGWFGVRHGITRWSHTRYYDDAVDTYTLRNSR